MVRQRNQSPDYLGRMGTFVYNQCAGSVLAVTDINNQTQNTIFEVSNMSEDYASHLA